MKIRIGKTNHMSADDHRLVSEAVSKAEKATDGEIVTIVADISDDYRETAYAVASLAALAVLAAFALWPDFYSGLLTGITDDWNIEMSVSGFAAYAGSAALLKWLSIWAILQWQPLRLLFTMPHIKRKAVHARAVDLFRVGTQARTAGRTGILIYLSLKEHRAEILGDEAINSKIEPEIWGDAMLALINKTRSGQPGEGMAQAVQHIGEPLAEHFPKSRGNSNELPDRLIEL